MEDFIWRLAVAVIPFVVLVASVTSISYLCHRHAHHPLSWHRRRRHMLRDLASGAILR